MMRIDNTLDALLQKMRQAVLVTLLLRPERSWYLHGLASHLGVRPSNLRRDLARDQRKAI
jgi:hypothetical protein